jgi:hypothetical protein
MATNSAIEIEGWEDINKFKPLVWADFADESKYTKDTGATEIITDFTEKSDNAFFFEQTDVSRRPVFAPNRVGNLGGMRCDNTIETQGIKTFSFIDPYVFGKPKEGNTIFSVWQHATGTVSVDDEVICNIRMANNNNSYKHYIDFPGPNFNIEAFTQYVTDNVVRIQDLEVTSITWISGNTVRIAFGGSPNLLASGVITTDIVRIYGANNYENNGQGVITAIDDVGKTIDVENKFRTDASLDEGNVGATAIINDSVGGAMNMNATAPDDYLGTDLHVMMSQFRHKSDQPNLRDEVFGQMVLDNLGIVEIATGTAFAEDAYCAVEDIFLGMRHNNFHGFNGWVYEVIMFNRPLNDYEIGRVWYYLNRKWQTGYEYGN